MIPWKLRFGHLISYAFAALVLACHKLTNGLFGLLPVSLSVSLTQDLVTGDCNKVKIV